MSELIIKSTERGVKRESRAARVRARSGRVPGVRGSGDTPVVHGHGTGRGAGTQNRAALPGSRCPLVPAARPGSGSDKEPELHLPVVAAARGGGSGGRGGEGAVPALRFPCTSSHTPRDGGGHGPSYPPGLPPA